MSCAEKHKRAEEQRHMFGFVMFGFQLKSILYERIAD